MSILIALKGFTLGLSMIIPIGAQNAMVLNQGINRNHHLVVATICALADILLVTLGVLGGSFILASNNLMFNILTWGGILFLVGYGISSFKAALLLTNDESTQPPPTYKSLKIVVFSALAVTFLNPHVYIDTVMVLGSVGGQFKTIDQFYFIGGTITASIVWFFSLAVAAAKLSHILARPKVKRIIDIGIAIIMWIIAASLFERWFDRFFN